MRVVCTADWQGMAPRVDPALIPDGDMFICAGDICGWGNMEELEAFNAWLGNLPHKFKIVTGGNHSLALRHNDGHRILTNAIYLQDELVVVENLKIYGTPLSEMNDFYFTSRFNAFSDPIYLQRAAGDIPEGLDILITHGPAYGVLDRVAYTGESVGSKHLRNALMRARPRYLICGHIHESYGETDFLDTRCVNAAICSNRNQLFREDESLYNSPIVLDIEPKLERDKNV